MRLDQSGVRAKMFDGSSQEKIRDREFGNWDMLISIKLFLDARETEVSFPGRLQSQLTRFADQSEFQKQEKWHILTENPEWEIDPSGRFYDFLRI